MIRVTVEQEMYIKQNPSLFGIFFTIIPIFVVPNKTMPMILNDVVFKS